MNSSVEVSLEPKRVGAHPRIVALLSLAALAAGVAWTARGVYYAVTDSWMAPITLGPENDQVLQINVKLNEQMVQRDKFKADIQRIDADLGGIDIAIGRFRTIQANTKESLRWTQNTTNAQTAAMNDRVRSLAAQKVLLESMLSRQEVIATNAKKNAEAGLLSRQELDREAQASDQLKLALAQNMRDSSDSRMQSAQFFATADVLKDAMENRSRIGIGILPEVAAGQERDARMDLELIRLESERRSLVTQRTIAADSLERMEDVFKTLRSRPLYRAVEAKTDVAFVPYTQLENMRAGDELVSCKWALFQCRVVGRVAEVLPGEVIAQDPWSDLARGQYAILDLHDHEAAKEKVLRSRKKR